MLNGEKGASFANVIPFPERKRFRTYGVADYVWMGTALCGALYLLKEYGSMIGPDFFKCPLCHGELWVSENELCPLVWVTPIWHMGNPA